MDNLEDFFSADPSPVEPETEIVTQVETAAEPTVDTPTDEGSAAADIIEVEAPEEKPDTRSWVPVAALKQERENARKEKAEVERLKTELARYQQTQTPVSSAPAAPTDPASQQIPDPYDDPSAYHQFVVAQAQAHARQELENQHVNYSIARATQKHGAETVEEARAWFLEQSASNPNLYTQAVASPDPAEWVLEHKKRSDLLNSFGSDPDAYVRQRAAELGFAAVAPVAAPALQPTATKDTGPESLVTAKSRNDNVVNRQTAKDSFDAIFK